MPQEFTTLKPSVGHVKFVDDFGMTIADIPGIIEGAHTDERIMAFRGTDSELNYVQGLSLILEGPLIRTTIKDAASKAEEHGVNWICGHSLGGVIAECACARTGIGGAAFNSPGPWSPNPLENLVPGDNYRGRPFEIHLTSNDVFSNAGKGRGPDSSHIGKPKWHYHGGGHTMWSLREDIESSAS